MDQYTTIPDVVIENVLVDTAETGKKWGMSCLTFASIIMIKVGIIGFFLYKHWKQEGRRVKKEFSTEMPEEKYRSENWATTKDS